MPTINYIKNSKNLHMKANFKTLLTGNTRQALQEWKRSA